MDPATTIVSVVGLLIPFIQQRQGAKDAERDQTIQDFVEWLRRKEHTEVLRTIESHHQLYESIDHLLRTGTKSIAAQLEELNKNVLQIMLHSHGWQDIARTFPVSHILSDQSLMILLELETRQASFAQELPQTRSGYRALLTDKGSIEVNEPRFIDDDLHQLVSLGLLEECYSSDLSSRYRVTRLGSAVAQQRLTVKNQIQNSCPNVAH